MPRRRLLILILAAALPLMPGCVAAPAQPAAPPIDHAALDSAIRRGVDFLLRTQNRDGSWGSARNTTGGDVYAPAPGAHHAFRAAVTAMCISALIQTRADRPAAGPAAASLDRAEDWLLRFLPQVKRNTGDAIYNVWAHAYAISALCDMLARHADDPAKCRRIRDTLDAQIDRLARYEFIGGGWGYYDFRDQTQRPSGDPTSFTTATVLLALHQAKDAGVNVPQKLVDRALAEVRRSRLPTGAYLYARNHWIRPTLPVNQIDGSVGRTQACNAALRVWGDPLADDAMIRSGLEAFCARHGWLDLGRKRPIPHESYFQVAGYFFYYGHYHAAVCFDLLPEAERPAYKARLAPLLIGLQETDGSWWDFPLYNYHQPYGTAFALLTLARCR